MKSRRVKEQAEKILDHRQGIATLGSPTGCADKIAKHLGLITEKSPGAKFAAVKSYKGSR
jgi:23S rRNA A2030 N6-methylase RlmJ